MKLTEHQISIMKHTYSDNRRNWFGTSRDSKDGIEFEKLVAAGYARVCKGASWMGDEYIYSLTEEGKQALKQQMPPSPSGLEKTDTIEDALSRADQLSAPDGSRHSGLMTSRKDLRRIVLLAREYRKLQMKIARMEKEKTV